MNCYKNDQGDREIISQIIKFKPKIKHHQHYLDCIRYVCVLSTSLSILLNSLKFLFRELAKQNTEIFEIILQIAILNEFTQLRSQHNINVIQVLFNLNGRLATTVSIIIYFGHCYLKKNFLKSYLHKCFIKFY